MRGVRVCPGRDAQDEGNLEFRLPQMPRGKIHETNHWVSYQFQGVSETD